MRSVNPILRKAAETLLFKRENFKDIYDDLHALHDVYASLNGVMAGDISDQDIWLPSGNAVSTIKAAHCLLEIQRTAVFTRGVYKAILALQKTFPGQRLHILYAGCGPYASLLTPLTTCFGSKELAFHLLDINEVSLEAAQKLYQALQLEEYVEEWVLTDATTYQVPGTIHLMVSETMLNGLRKEPQLAIMQHLIPQLPKGGVFVPGRIAVSCWLLSRRQETDRYLQPDQEPERIKLGTLYAIGLEHYSGPDPVVVKMPGKIEAQKDLFLLTDITAFEEEKLGIYESSLNMPIHIGRVEGYENRKILFTYQMGEHPGFIHEWI